MTRQRNSLPPPAIAPGKKGSGPKVGIRPVRVRKTPGTQAPSRVAASRRAPAAVPATLAPGDDDFRSFFQALDDLLFVVDNAGAIRAVNRVVSDRLGYGEEELTGRSILQVHPPERRPEAAAVIAAMVAGDARSCFIPLQTKNGALIPVETRVVRGRWQGQDVLFGISKDLTELRESEEKFSKAFAASPVLMALSTLEEGRFLDVNRTFLQTLGYAREEVVGRTSTELALFADADVRDRIVEEIRANGFVRNMDLRVKTRDGRIRHGSFAADILRLQRAPCLLTVLTDITERKEMEAALARSEAESRALLNAVPELLFELDDRAVFLDRRGRLEGLAMAPEGFIGKAARHVLPPDAWAALRQAMVRARRTGNVQVFDYPMTLPDGLSHAFEARLTVNRTGGFIISSRDVTARREAELRLRRLQEELEDRVRERTGDLERLSETLRLKERQQSAILGNIPDIAWLKDKKSRFIMVNDAFARACGSGSPEALVGKTDFDVWPEDLARLYVRDDREVMAKGIRKQVVEPIADPDGKERWIETVKTPILDEKGRVAGTTGIAREITERIQAEENIKKANDLLRALTGRLADAEERQLKMISRELHDQIGQNLNTIGLNLTLLQSLVRESTPAAVKMRLEDSLALVRETAGQIRNLTAELRSPVLDDYGLLAALRWYGDQCGRRFGIAVSVRGRDPVPRPAARVEIALYRISQEALTNVVKHARATKVRISLRTGRKKLLLTIADDGVGWAPDSKDSHGAPRGWGLITMQERALAVGGTFRITAGKTGGTRISVEAPL